MNSMESIPLSAGQGPRRSRFRRRLRRIRSSLYRPVARVRTRRRTRPGPPHRIDKKLHWRGSNPLKRSIRILVYGGGLLLLGALAWAVDAVFVHRSFAMDNRCQQRALSCGILASFLVPSTHSRTGIRLLPARSALVSAEAISADSAHQAAGCGADCRQHHRRCRRSRRAVPGNDRGPARAKHPASARGRRRDRHRQDRAPGQADQATGTTARRPGSRPAA